MSLGRAQPAAAEEFERLLGEALAFYPIRLEAAAVTRLARYLTLLDVWRRRTNLTGMLTARELARHALEGALGASFVPSRARLADIGSGAGFPGLPLALARPDVEVTPVEPRRKRAEFLRQAIQAIPIENAVLPIPKVSLLPPDGYDVATSRAVGGIAEILGAAPFLVPGGLFLAWTTEPERLAGELSPHFTLEHSAPIPQTREKQIAAYRKRGRSQP